MPLSRVVSLASQSSPKDSRNTRTTMTSNRSQTTSRTFFRPRTAGKARDRVEKLRRLASSHRHVSARQKELGQRSKISTFVDRFLSGGIFMEMVNNLCQYTRFLPHRLPASMREVITRDLGPSNEVFSSADENIDIMLEDSHIKGSSDVYEDEYKRINSEQRSTRVAAEDEHIQQHDYADETPTFMTPATHSYLLDASDGRVTSLIPLSGDRVQQLKMAVQSEQRILAYIAEIESLGLPQLELQICSATGINDYEGLRQQRDILQARREDLLNEIKLEEERMIGVMQFVGCPKFTHYYDKREDVFKDLHKKRNAFLVARYNVKNGPRDEWETMEEFNEMEDIGENPCSRSHMQRAILYHSMEISKQLTAAEADFNAVKRQARDLGISFWDPEQESCFVDDTEDGYRESEEPWKEASVDRERVHRWIDSEEEVGIPECDDWDCREVAYGEDSNTMAEEKERVRIDSYQEMCAQWRVERDAMVQE